MTCGTCTACCTVFSISELEKPAGKTCEHACAGCMIYEKRPQTCRTYFCLYADEKAAALDLPEWARPDKIGVILNGDGPDLNEHHIIAFELTEGAADGYWADRLLKRLNRRFDIAIQHGEVIRQIRPKGRT